MTRIGHPDGTTTIYLVRHGRTPLNAQGLLRGHLDPDLDDEGAAQAERLANALGSLPIVKIVSSPLRRATETAAAIATRSRLEVETEMRVTDRDYGPWAGKSLQEVSSLFGSVDRAPGVEPREAIQARSMLAIEELLRLTHGRASVMVSHDAIIRSILQALDPSLGGEVPMETGCYNVLTHRGGGWQVVSTNQRPM